MKRTQLLVISGVILLALGIALAGCSFFPGMDKMDKAEPETAGDAEQSRREHLAILKTLDNHKVGMDELYAIVNSVVQQTLPEGRSIVGAKNTVSGMKKLPLSGENFFAPANLSRPGRSVVADTEEEPVEVYEFAIGESGNADEGFVWASNDIRIGNILAIAEGSLEDTSDEFVDLMYAYLQNYISSVILEYNSITETEIEEAIEKAAQGQPEEAREIFDTPSGYTYFESSHNFKSQKGPLLTTKWGQGTEGTKANIYGAGSSNYYAYNNYVKHIKEEPSYVTGCGPTAIAQIVAYYGYMKSTVAKKPAPFEGTGQNYALGKWDGAYDWAFLKDRTKVNETIKNPSSTFGDTDNKKKARGQVAALMYHVGVLAGAKYGVKGTSTVHSGEKKAFTDMGYTIHYSKSGSATVKKGTLNTGFSVTSNTSWATIKNALDKGWPVFIGGFSLEKNGKSGHAWVIDGWGTMTYYYEYFKNAAGQTTYGLGYSNLTNNFLVHCNLGWNGNSDGWYIYGMFNTDRILDLPRSTVYESDFSIDTEIIIPKEP